MPHVLHLITDPTNDVPLEVVARQAQNPAITLSVVLLHDAVHLRARLPARVFRLDEGRHDTVSSEEEPSITHARLLDLIFAADTVVTW